MPVNLQESGSIIVFLGGLFLAAVTVVVIVWMCIFHKENNRKTKILEDQLQHKNDELQKVINELKSTQVRLIESGKVSAAAALSAGILHQISQPITAIHGFVNAGAIGVMRVRALTESAEC